METLMRKMKSCDTDSEKIAVLITICKIVKPESMTTQLQEKVAQVITFNFVSRLLKVSPEDCNSLLYWQLAISIIKSCFLSPTYKRQLRESSGRMVQIAVDAKSSDTECEVIDIINFIMPVDLTSEVSSKFNRLVDVILPKIPSLLNINDWCTIVSYILPKIQTDNDAESNERSKTLKTTVETLISEIEKESPTSICKNLNLIKGATKLISSESSLYQNISNFSTLKHSTQQLLKSKIPADKRLSLLSVAPFLTMVYSYNSWEGTKLCYSLSCIELKLTLEELVHKYEEAESNVLSDVQLEGIMSCCATIENNIDELVDENSTIPVDLVQSMLDNIRMTMKSVMFYLQKELISQGSFTPVVRLFMRWLSDDTFEMEDIISTLTSLQSFIQINYKDYGSFIVAGVINQMEHKEFRDYFENKLGHVLLEVSLEGAITQQLPMVFAPIFNDLMTYYVLIDISSIFHTKADSICSLFCHEEKTLSFYNLTAIQVSTYLILCAAEHGISISTFCKPYNLSQWLKKSIDYLLSPVKDEDPPQHWYEVKEVWISSVYCLSECIDKSNNISLGDIDLGFLIKKVMNNSESCDDVTTALENLLALITQL